MTTITVVKQNEESVTFNDVMGHQVGNGAVQLIMEDGTQFVFNNFIEVFVDFSDEEKADFKARLDQAKAEAPEAPETSH